MPSPTGGPLSGFLLYIVFLLLCNNNNIISCLGSGYLAVPGPSVVKAI